MMPGSLRLGKIAGIEISVHVSWLIIFVLLTWSLATGWFPVLYPGWSAFAYWIVSLLAALLLFVKEGRRWRMSLRGLCGALYRRIDAKCE